MNRPYSLRVYNVLCRRRWWSNRKQPSDRRYICGYYNTTLYIFVTNEPYEGERYVFEISSLYVRVLQQIYTFDSSSIYFIYDSKLHTVFVQIETTEWVTTFQLPPMCLEHLCTVRPLQIRLDGWTSIGRNAYQWEWVMFVLLKVFDSYLLLLRLELLLLTDIDECCYR